jgi:branched-subunit amino acid ABC-type transport system permease component
MRVINVAHGEFVVLGAYLTFVVFNSPQLSTSIPCWRCSSPCPSHSAWVISCRKCS